MIGSDCAAVISREGEGMTIFKIGDKVISKP